MTHNASTVYLKSNTVHRKVFKNQKLSESKSLKNLKKNDSWSRIWRPFDYQSGMGSKFRVFFRSRGTVPRNIVPVIPQGLNPRTISRP